MCLTIFENYHILLNKISLRFLVTAKLFSMQKSLINSVSQHVCLFQLLPSLPHITHYLITLRNELQQYKVYDTGPRASFIKLFTVWAQCYTALYVHISLFFRIKIAFPFSFTVRPELTRVKYLSSAPLLGWLLALLTNIKLGLKGQPRTNNLAFYENS